MEDRSRLPLAEELDRLVSECGAIISSLERIEQTAILNAVKWGLRGEMARLEDLKQSLQQLATENLSARGNDEKTA